MAISEVTDDWGQPLRYFGGLAPFSLLLFSYSPMFDFGMMIPVMTKNSVVNTAIKRVSAVGSQFVVLYSFETNMALEERANDVFLSKC